MQQNYGGTDVVKGMENRGKPLRSSLFLPGHRRRINVVAICVNIFLPPLIFSCICSVMSFSVHYTHARRAWSVVAFFTFVAFVVLSDAVRMHSRRERDPQWHAFSSLSLFAAVLVATIVGDTNFVYNMQAYYDILNLNVYPSTNPAIASGQEMMDAGRVYFSDGTTLDMTKAMSFQESDLYCVAPIINGESMPSGYDFWAVGVNCCNPVSSDFRCGQFNNPAARSGLRLMDAEQKPYFRLAVQQATEAYHIRAPHPLFFEWMQDPTNELEKYLETGWKWYLVSIFTFFAINTFAVIIAVVGFSRMGHHT